MCWGLDCCAGKSSRPPRGQSRDRAHQLFRSPPQARGSRTHLPHDFSWHVTSRLQKGDGQTTYKCKRKQSTHLALVSACEMHVPTSETSAGVSPGPSRVTAQPWQGQTFWSSSVLACRGGSMNCCRILPFSPQGMTAAQSVRISQHHELSGVLLTICF